MNKRAPHIRDKVVREEAGDDGNETVAKEDGLGECLVEPLSLITSLQKTRNDRLFRMTGEALKGNFESLSKEKCSP